MKIEVNLEDKRCCGGCPCISGDDSGGCYCSLGFFEDVNYGWLNKLTNKIFIEDPPDNERANPKLWLLVYIRPQACIDKHGE